MAESSSGWGSAIAYGLRVGKGLWRSIGDRGESKLEAFDKAGGAAARERFQQSTIPKTAPQLPPDPVATRFEQTPARPPFSKSKPGRKMFRTTWRINTWLDELEKTNPLAFEAMMGVAQSGAMDPTGRFAQLRGTRVPSARTTAQARGATGRQQRGQVGTVTSPSLKRGTESSELDKLLGKSRATDLDRLLRGKSFKPGGGVLRQSQNVRPAAQTSRARPAPISTIGPPGGGTPSANEIERSISSARATRRAEQLPIGSAGPGSITADAVPDRKPANAGDPQRSQRPRSAAPGRKGAPAPGVSPGPQLSYFPGFPIADAVAGPLGGRKGTASRSGTPRAAAQAVPIGATALNGGGRSNDCDCTSKKKARKPRKPRSTCYRGTYIENARGLVKTRREQVPC